MGRLIAIKVFTLGLWFSNYGTPTTLFFHLQTFLHTGKPGVLFVFRTHSTVQYSTVIPGLCLYRRRDPGAERRVSTRSDSRRSFAQIQSEKNETTESTDSIVLSNPSKLKQTFVFSACLEFEQLLQYHRLAECKVIKMLFWLLGIGATKNKFT